MDTKRTITALAITALAALTLAGCSAGNDAAPKANSYADAVEACTAANKTSAGTNGSTDGLSDDDAATLRGTAAALLKDKRASLDDSETATLTAALTAKTLTADQVEAMGSGCQNVSVYVQVNGTKG